MTKLACGILGLFMVLVLVLSACAAPQSPAPVPAPAPTPSTAPAAPAVGTGTAQQLVIEAAKKEGEVVIWSNTAADLDVIRRQFNEKYPFLKLTVWDARSAEITVKLAEEAKAGKFTPDLISTSINDTVDLMNLGILQDYSWPAATQKWTDQPKHNFYRSYITNLKVMAYNTNLLPKADAPKTWDDLKDQRWRGKAMISSSGDVNPLFMALIWGAGGKLDWDKSESYWRTVIQNARPLVQRGYPIELIAAGEAALFISAASITTQIMIDRGAPVDYAPVSPVMSTPFSISVLKNNPHPNATRLFLENLTSPEGLLVWSEAFRSLVFDPEVAKRSRIHKIVADRKVESILIPVEAMTTENLRRSASFWQKELGVRG
ncbi:MAG: hypothetical protein HW414_345 [Dehalococcoidia bacterium]|nr:hypothetical protein [Dehalococcoidia bacterium]